MHLVITGIPVEEIQVIAAVGTLLRIFHPAVLSVVIRIYSRNRTGQKIECQVIGLPVAFSSPDSGADFQPLCDLTGDIGTQKEFLRAGIVNDSRIVHVCHGNKILGTTGRT